jgi:hypothetical protein
LNDRLRSRANRECAAHFPERRRLLPALTALNDMQIDRRHLLVRQLAIDPSDYFR